MFTSIQTYKPIVLYDVENTIIEMMKSNISPTKKFVLYQVKVDVTEILNKTKEGTQIKGTGHPDV